LVFVEQLLMSMTSGPLELKSTVSLIGLGDEGGSVLRGTYAPVDVAPPPKPQHGVNSGMGPKNDNYDDHPDLGIAGLG
jgi:hypothetical protein